VPCRFGYLVINVVHFLRQKKKMIMFLEISFI